MRRPNTVPTLVAVAVPDHVNIARAAAVARGTARPLKGLSGVVGYDRGDAAHSFNGPIPAAQNVDRAYGKIAASDDNIHYRAPGMHDAALANTPLGTVARVQYERMLAR